MTTFSPSDAALEGFRLTRERPLTIAAWALINALGVSLIGALMLLALGGPLIDLIKKGRFENIDPTTLAAVMADSWPAFLGIVLVVFLFSAILVAGVYRLVLRPNERGLAHLRVGRIEFKLALANLMLFPAGVIWFGFVNVVGAGVAATSGVFMGVVAGLIALTPMVYVGVRLLLLTPRIFDTGRISLREAWDLSRGKFWQLLAMFILSAIFYVMVWALIFIIHGALLLAGGGPEAVYSVSGGAMAIPVIILVFALEAILPVLQLILLTGPLAIAYQKLTQGAEA
jgi:hypothetical protein